MILKTTKNMCRGLSVVYKITTTRRSTIDVRKKLDLSRKNRTTGSPGHVRKIWDWPQPDDQVEAQLDSGPETEIGGSYNFAVKWDWTRFFKIVETKLGNLLTKWPFWLSLWHMMIYRSISWHGLMETKELEAWYVLPTLSSIRGARWCRYSAVKCLPDSHLPFVYVVILSISPLWKTGETNPMGKTSKCSE